VRVVEKVPESRREQIVNSVIVGEDGFLFHTGDWVVEQVCGSFALSPRQLQRWVSLIEARHAWCDARGIKFYTLVIPEKHVVYEDKLPAAMKVSPTRPVKKIVNALAPRVLEDFLYLDEILKAGRCVDETYYRTDVHWTGYGAYLGYVALVNAMRRSLPIQPLPEAELVRRPMRMVGNLGMALDSEPDEEATALSHPLARNHLKILGNRAYSIGQAEVFEDAMSDLPKLVIFRDSNATTMFPFLCNHFSRIAAVASQRVFYDLIISERPDVVIMEVTERYVARPAELGVSDALMFPEDFGPEDFSTFTGEHLPLPTRQRDFVIDFRAGGNSQNYIGSGWSGQEPQQVWATGTESTLVIPAPEGPIEYELELDLTGCVFPPQLTSQALDVMVNGLLTGSFEIGTDALIRCRVPLECFSTTTILNFRFRHPGCVRPSDYRETADSRLLAVGFKSLRLRPTT
jgi:hypothetical protein